MSNTTLEQKVNVIGKVEFVAEVEVADKDTSIPNLVDNEEFDVVLVSSTDNDDRITMRYSTTNSQAFYKRINKALRGN